MALRTHPDAASLLALAQWIAQQWAVRSGAYPDRAANTVGAQLVKAQPRGRRA